MARRGRRGASAGDTGAAARHAGVGVPAVGQWLYEIKFDGYRLLARIEGGRARLVTRGGHDWTAKASGGSGGQRGAEARARAGSTAKSWCSAPTGRPTSTRCRTPSTCPHGAATYFVFDLPFLDGHDLRQVPLRERRRLLAELMRTPAEPLRFSADRGGPDEVLEAACRMQLEGLIAKRADAPYVSRRSDTWLKLKCQRRQEFVIAVLRIGACASHGEVGSLLLGVYEGNDDSIRSAT